MDGTKHQSLLQPTEESGLTIRVLPGHDFGDPCLYVTPSVYRFMSHEVKQMDGKFNITTYYNKFLFNCIFMIVYHI